MKRLIDREAKLNDFHKFYSGTVANLNSTIETLRHLYADSYGAEYHNDPHWRNIRRLEELRQVLREVKDGLATP